MRLIEINEGILGCILSSVLHVLANKVIEPGCLGMNAVQRKVCLLFAIPPLSSLVSPTQCLAVKLYSHPQF